MTVSGTPQFASIIIYSRRTIQDFIFSIIVQVRYTKTMRTHGQPFWRMFGCIKLPTGFQFIPFQIECPYLPIMINTSTDDQTGVACSHSGRFVRYTIQISHPDKETVHAVSVIISPIFTPIFSTRRFWTTSTTRNIIHPGNFTSIISTANRDIFGTFHYQTANCINTCSRIPAHSVSLTNSIIVHITISIGNALTIPKLCTFWRAESYFT